jgi:peptide deformylase
MELSLVKWPDPILAKPCLPIEDLTKWHNIAKKMFEIMYENHGCGLAAPQVGLLYRIFVLNTTGKEMVFINPILHKVNKGNEEMEEGCLSLPGIKMIVSRPRQILVSWTDLDGDNHKSQYEGITSRAWLHENDHLNGILIATPN